MRQQREPQGPVPSRRTTAEASVRPLLSEPKPHYAPLQASNGTAFVARTVMVPCPHVVPSIGGDDRLPAVALGARNRHHAGSMVVR